MHVQEFPNKLMYKILIHKMLSLYQIFQYKIFYLHPFIAKTVKVNRNWVLNPSRGPNRIWIVSQNLVKRLSRNKNSPLCKQLTVFWDTMPKLSSHWEADWLLNLWWVRRLIPCSESYTAGGKWTAMMTMAVYVRLMVCNSSSVFLLTWRHTGVCTESADYK